MIHNRKTLLSFLAKCGYDGKEDLNAAKAFIVSSNLELVDESDNAIDVDALWSKTEAKRVKADIATNDEGDEDEDRLAGKRKVVVGKAARVDAANGIVRKGNAMFGVDYAKKAYDRKAKAGGTVFSEADEAEAVGAFLRQTIAKAARRDYDEADNDARIIAKTGLTTNGTGQSLIPDDLSTTIINLRESVAGAGRFCTVETMSRDVQSFPRESGGTTVYWPGEGNTITASDLSNDNVSLTARKAAALSKLSSELLNDAAVSVADRLTNRMSYDILKAEEQCALVGDGTSTYGTHVGLTYRYQQMVAAAGGTWTTDANKLYHAGVVGASGNLFSEVAKVDFTNMIGRLPQYDTGEEPQFMCSRPFYWATAQALGHGVGGVTNTEWINGVARNTLLGYNVIFTPWMQKVDAASCIPCVFGYFNMGIKCGRVRGSMSIAQSEHVGFAEDVIYFRITNRFAVSVHDIGNATSTAADRVAGPIVALAMNNA